MMTGQSAYEQQQCRQRDSKYFAHGNLLQLQLGSDAHRAPLHQPGLPSPAFAVHYRAEIDLA